MTRDFSKFLMEWLGSKRRKPLIIRGARQVGKTWLVRELARSSGRELLEVNFDRNPEYARIFREEGAGPRRWLDDLALRTGVDAPDERLILFLDEIQGTPEVLAKLRWFSEEMPGLPVIAAGSLLEFALRDFPHSMPVGRVSFAFVEPMSFPEFLRAHGRERLLRRLADWTPGAVLGDAAHSQASEYNDRYLMTGGMPEVVAADVEGARAAECLRLQRDLIQTCRSDFSKYSGRMDPRILDEVLRGVVDQLGGKFVLSHVGDVKHQQARRALDLLCMAQLCDTIPHAECNGLPRAGKINPRVQKVILLDCGLAHGLWNTPAGNSFVRPAEMAPGLRGALAEQGDGQQLRIAVGEPTRRGALFHWRREGGRAGEVDFVLECDGLIVPVETKSGAAGAMKSLHQFMHDKSLALAVRLDNNPPSKQEVRVETTLGQPVSYSILNLPHHMAWRVPSLLQRDGPVRK